MSLFDRVTPTPVVMRDEHNPEHLREDETMLRLGVLDPKSFEAGYEPCDGLNHNPVEVMTTSILREGQRVRPELLVTDPVCFTRPVTRPDGLIGEGRVWRQGLFRRGEWIDLDPAVARPRYVREIRRQVNQRLNVGRDQWQRISMFGDIGANLNGFAISGSATVPTSTTFTSGSTLPTATSAAGNAGLQGHLLYVANAISSSAFTNPVMGVILSNTASVITVDQWYAVPVTGAAGTTPAANSAGLVLPGGSLGWWVALSTSTAAAAAGDVTRTADGLWGDGTGSGAATEITANGLARAFVGYGGTTAPTFPAGGQQALLHTWTYTTSASSTTLGKVILFNSLAAAGTIPLFETLLNATGTVSAVNDTLTVNTWQFTI